MKSRSGSKAAGRASDRAHEGANAQCGERTANKERRGRREDPTVDHRAALEMRARDERVRLRAIEASRTSKHRALGNRALTTNGSLRRAAWRPSIRRSAGSGRIQRSPQADGRRKQTKSGMSAVGVLFSESRCRQIDMAHASSESLSIALLTGPDREMSAVGGLRSDALSSSSDAGMGCGLRTSSQTANAPAA